MREAKKSAKFHLSGDAQAAMRAGSFSTLTHGGRSLEELEELNSQPAELLGDLDDDVLEELVEQYHFGGGVQEQAADDRQEDGQQRRKTKKEVGYDYLFNACISHQDTRSESIAASMLLSEVVSGALEL